MFRNLKQPYLRNRLMDFYRTKTKSYLEASFIIVCGKESAENKQKFWCNMPTMTSPCLQGLPFHTLVYNTSIACVQVVVWCNNWIECSRGWAKWAPCLYIIYFEGLTFIVCQLTMKTWILYIIITLIAIVEQRYQEISQVHCCILLQVRSTSNNAWGNERVMFPRYRHSTMVIRYLSYI